jgi:hypothetical protein
MNGLTQILQMQHLRQQNDLGAQQTAEYQRGVAGDNKLAELLANNFKPEEVANKLAGAGYGKQSMAYTKQQQDLAKQQVDMSKTKSETGKLDQETAGHQFELAGQLAASWAQNPSVTQDHIRAGLASAAHSKIISPEIYQAKLAELDGIPGDAPSLNKWALGTLQQVQKAKDSMSFIAPDANTVANNKTSVATNAATNLTSRANNAATQAGENARAAASQKNQLLINGIGADGAPSGDVETMAQGIASGKLAPINGFALAKPRGQQIMARAMEINPNYDAGDYAAKNAALKGFSTGKEGTALRSFNVATDHLETLGTMADALNNGNIQLLNKAGNMWNQQTGVAAPTNFNAVKEIVGKEVVKAIVAGGGGVEERKEMSQLLDAANSPAQLKGVITHFKELMGAQRDGLVDQYQRTTGRTDGATAFAPSKRGASVGPTPAAGVVEGGYKFKGGDPSDKSNWVKQ